jgi:acid phosphatase
MCGMLLLAACSGEPPSANGSSPTTGSTTQIGSTTPGTSRTSVTGTPGPVPRPDHVVVVIEENHSYADIIGSGAPYLNSLANQGAMFTASFAVTHPSEPNYLALFSGSTQGLSDDSCPHTFTGPNLGAQLISAGFTFTGYSEGLPSIGYASCSSGGYARKHNPWSNFRSVPATASQPFSAFPTDYTTLATVSFVIPNLSNDMHDGTIAQADTWLHTNLNGYVQWAKSHNSLLVVTWDEDDYSESNQIPTFFVGQHIKQGRYGERIDHYSVLRTLEAAYGLPAIGQASSIPAITDCWQP